MENAQPWASLTSQRLASLALKARNVCPRSHMVHRLLSPLASHLFDLAALLKELQREAGIRGARLSNSSMRDMDYQLQLAEQLIDDYSGRCHLYLLMCCPDLLSQLKTQYASLKPVLDSLLQDERWSASLKRRLATVKQSLDEGSLKLGSNEQILHESLEHGVLDSIVVDSSLFTKVARQIAECLNFSLDSEAFATELANLKAEKAGAEARRGKAHSLYLEQFIVLLDKAVAATAKPANREAPVTLVSQSSAARDTLILPLQSFVCPITKDVMRDPVQIASGQTYERAAIERWFEDGHTRCPTGVELMNTKMKSNIALRQSIAEWKERNNHIRLDLANEQIRSENKELHLKALQDLQALCEEDSLNKYKVASRDLMPVLVHLAESSDLELRQKAFSTLGLLAKDNAECQEIMVQANVIGVLVRCLARQYEETPQCVHLMRTLSGNAEIAEKISHAPSAILFLVTLIEDEECAENVKATLENLPKSDENIVIMAEANIMKPLVSRLNEGGSASKILMAKTLGRLHMTESSKSVVATKETVGTLARMVKESSNEEVQESGVVALENLTTEAAVRRWLGEEGAMEVLLRVLKGVRYSEVAKRASAAVLANMMGEEWISEAELDETVCTFLQLLGPTTAPSVQVPVLQGLLGIARNSSNEATLLKLKEFDALRCLLQLHHFISSLDHSSSTSSSLRLSCLQLLTCLASKFHAEAAQAAIALPASLLLLVDMVKDPSRAESELQLATSFLANLPTKDSQITSLLQTADVIPSLVKHLDNHRNEALVEAAAGALLRFTLPEDTTMQLRLGSAGVIEMYVRLLRSGGSVGKERAAKALTNFSSNSKRLSEVRAEEMGGGACCFGCRWRAAEAMCAVHGGRCSVEATFCLVAAHAVEVIVAMLRDEAGEGRCTAAGLMALATLVEAEAAEGGAAAIEKERGVEVVIDLLSNQMLHVQELAAQLLEKLFTVPRYRAHYGARAQMHIVTLAQKGTPSLRQLAGRILHQLELVHTQSSYFGASSSLPFH